MSIENSSLSREFVWMNKLYDFEWQVTCQTKYKNSFVLSLKEKQNVPFALKQFQTRATKTFFWPKLLSQAANNAKHEKQLIELDLNMALTDYDEAGSFRASPKNELRRQLLKSIGILYNYSGLKLDN